MAPRYFAIKVTTAEGGEDYVCDGIGNRVSRFYSRESAKQQADFLEMGLDEGDQAAVVYYPTPEVLKAEGYAV